MNTITKTIAGIFGMMMLLSVQKVQAQNYKKIASFVYSNPNDGFTDIFFDVSANVYINDPKGPVLVKIETKVDVRFTQYSYREDGKIYTLNEIGSAPFANAVISPKMGFEMEVRYDGKTERMYAGNGTINHVVVAEGFDLNSIALSIVEKTPKNQGDAFFNSAVYNAILKYKDRLKQDKEAEEKKKKEEEEKKRKEAETKNKQTTSKKETSNETTSNNKSTDDFSGDGSTSKKSTTSNNNNKDLYPKDENFVADSKFKNKLSGVKEGDYFTDGAGGYYKKELGGARKVDKMVYEREAANKIYEKMERKEAERQQRDAEFKQNWDNMSTSFYAMSAAKEGMRDAKDLGSGYSSIEELNAAFNQKMRQVSAMGGQMQASTNQAVQAYSKIVGTGSNGYDYSGYTNAIGTIASAISANKAENKAREELKRQRAEEEARIKKVQLDALIAIRTEIGKVYTEGGMPLSTHKITAPVLYVFAYNSNKADWDKNQNVTMSISNVIPVYQYSDGTYPYTSNVKRTFENAGISSPVLMGYFTNKSEAENYRSSLLEVAPNAKFAVKEVEVKVKEQKPNTKTNTSETDFWGTKTETKKQDNTQNTETDFWGTPTKDKKAEPKKETKKEVDFWSK